MDEGHIRVARSARYYSIGDAGPETRHVWLVCHGYGQLAGRFLRRFAVLDDGSHYIVAPEGLSRFYLEGAEGGARTVGATWMTREDRLHEIDDYVAYLDALCGRIFAEIEREAVEFTVLGFSQGVATVCRWAVRSPLAPDRLIAWAGSLPDELTPNPRLFGDARLTLVLGDRDPHVPDGAEQRLRSRLEEGGLPFEFVRFAGGHELKPSTLREVADTAGGVR